MASGDASNYLSTNDRQHLAEYERHLRILRDLARGVAKGYYTGGYITGRPGTGKSWTVKDELRRSGAAWTEQKGKATAMSLYDMLSEAPEHVLLLDDLTNLFADKGAQQLLMAALDGQPNEPRKVTYRTKGNHQSCNFTGGVIAISNLPLKRDPLANAVRSRCYVIAHEPTDEQLAAFMRTLCAKGYGDLKPEACLEVANFLVDESLAYELRVDLRFLNRSWALRLQWEHGQADTHWKELVKADLGKALEEQGPLSKHDEIVLQRAKVRRAMELFPDDVQKQLEASGLKRSTFYARRREVLAGM